MELGLSTTICLAACIGILLFQLATKRDLLSPGTLYLWVIIGTLGISFLRLMPAMTDFQPLTWIVLSLSSISFIAGLLIARTFWVNQGKRLYYGPVNQQEISRAYDNYDWQKHFRWTLFMGVLYGIAIIRFFMTYEAPTVLSKSFLTIVGKKGMDIGYFYLPIILYPLILMLIFPMLSRKTGFSSMRRFFLWVSFFLLWIIGILFWPTRGALFHLLVFLVMFYHVTVRRFRVKHLAVFILGIAFLFIAASSLKKQVAHIDLMSTSLWKLPYAYIANNYWNLDYAINPPSDRELHPLTWGHQTIGGMFALELWPDWAKIRDAYWWDGLFNERVEKAKNLNTHGYWWRLYKDFWIFGIVFFPLFGGLWQGWIYNRLRFQPSMSVLFIYSFITLFIVLSFFCDFWGMATSPMYLLALWTISKNCELSKEVDFG